MKPTEQRSANRVRLVGKVSRRGIVTYTPAGTPVCEFTVAVSQRHFEHQTVGYFDVVLVGEGTLESSERIRVGGSFMIRGSLWTRSFKNRQGRIVSETKIVAHSIKGVLHEKTGRQGKTEWHGKARISA